MFSSGAGVGIWNGRRERGVVLVVEELVEEVWVVWGRKVVVGSEFLVEYGWVVDMMMMEIGSASTERVDNGS